MVLGAFATAVKRKFSNSHITAIVNNSKDPLIGHLAIDNIRLHKQVHWDKVVKDNKYRFDIFFELTYVPKVYVNVVTLESYKKEVNNVFKRFSNEYSYIKANSFHAPQSLDRLNKNSIDLLCECACLNGGQKDLFIRISEHDQKIAESIPFDEFITINNGQFRGRETRCWPTDYWVELVKRINEIGIKAVLLGVEHDEYVEGSYDLRGKTSTYEAAAIIERALLHIDTEGGIVYIANSVGKKSIVLFGPDYPGFYGLDGNINIRTQEDICSPCCWWDNWRWTCHLGYERCKAMEAITPEEVFNIVVKELKLTLSFPG